MVASRVDVDLTDVDLAHADSLVKIIGRKSSRTDVICRALNLLFWAFVTKESDEVIVLKKGKEVGRFKWNDGVCLIAGTSVKC